MRVHLVTRRHLEESIALYPDAAGELRTWAKIVEGGRWRNFAEVKRLFRDADSVRGYVVFNIRHNRYRLITVIHYARTAGNRETSGHVYIRSFLTHKEYDNPANWDRKFGAK